MKKLTKIDKIERQRRHRHTIKEKKLFAWIMTKYNMTTDKELAAFLYSSSSQLSQIRNDHIAFSSRLILTTYDKTGLSIEQIRKMVKEDV